MPHYLVTTSFPQPIEAATPDAAQAIAENEDFGMVQVVEVENVAGVWRPTGEYTNLANLPRTVNVHLDDTELTALRTMLDDLIAGSRPYVELHTVLDGIPLHLRIVRD